MDKQTRPSGRVLVCRACATSLLDLRLRPQLFLILLQPLLLQSVQYWEVNNLELTNTKSAPGDYRGISVRGRDTGVLNHIYIRNCFVHDVTGVVNWIGGDVADDDPPWVKFQTGWDASKRTGGIVVEVDSANGTKTWFNDVVIENNVVQDTSFGGVAPLQEGGQGASWVPYFMVADPDEIVRKTQENGGSVLMPAANVPDVGTIAWLADTSGAVFAVLKPNPRQG